MIRRIVAQRNRAGIKPVYAARLLNASEFVSIETLTR